MTNAETSASATPEPRAGAALSDAVALMDAGGRVIAATAAFRRLFALRDDALAGGALDLAQMVGAIGGRIESVGNLGDLRPEAEAVVRLPDGTLIDLRSAPFPPMGTLIAASIADGTRIVSIDRSLMAAVLQAVPTTISVKDQEGRYLLVNPAWERIHGIAANDALGKRFDQIHMESADPSAQKEQQFEVVDRDQFVVRNNVAMHGMEETFIRGDGRRVTLLSQKVPLPNRDGRPIGVVSVTMDVTDLKETQAALLTARERAEAALVELRAAQGQLLQAEKLASLGVLLAGLAHEVSTPLGVALSSLSHIDGRSKAMRDQYASGELSAEEFTQSLEEIDQATSIALRTIERAVKLIGSLKRVSVDRAVGERRQFQIDAYIQDVASTLKGIYRPGGHTLDLDLQDTRIMDSFPGPLAQIITNFVNNAVLHGFEGRTGGSMRLASRPAGEDATELVFEDDGHGIPGHVLPRIFEPFYSTARHRGGSGIGLHLVYDIVTATLGGSIAVDSLIGQGTRFRLLLPLQAPAAGMTTLPEASDTDALGRKRAGVAAP